MVGKGGKRNAHSQRSLRYGDCHRGNVKDMDRGSDKRGLLSVPEVASHLGVSEVTVWRFCRDGSLPALRIGKQWRVRREALEKFLRRSERPVTLAGRLGSFLTVPDDVLAVAGDLELLRRLDTAFFQAGESRSATPVKLHGAQPESGDELRAVFERDGLEVGRLEEEGRFRFRAAGYPRENGRAEALRRVLEEAEGDRIFWASFDWTQPLDLEAAIAQQDELRAVVEGQRLVVLTAVLERVLDEWPPSPHRRMRAGYPGAVWISEAGLSLSRLSPVPRS